MMLSQYIRVVIPVLMLLFMPVIWWLPMLPSSSQALPRMPEYPSYEDVHLEDYYQDGRLHYGMVAQTLLQKEDESLWFTAPRVRVLVDERDRVFWHITASQAKLQQHDLAFMGDVRVQEQVECPIELDAQRFVYHTQDGSFDADGALEYRHAQDKVLARRASGVLALGRIQVYEGTSYHDPNKPGCQ